MWPEFSCFRCRASGGIHKTRNTSRGDCFIYSTYQRLPGHATSQKNRKANTLTQVSMSTRKWLILFTNPSAAINVASNARTQPCSLYSERHQSLNSDRWWPPFCPAQFRVNHNDNSFIKQFGCSHHKHVLYAHNPVVWGISLNTALVKAFLLTLHSCSPTQALRKQTYEKTQNLISLKSRALLSKNHTTRLKNLIFKA